MSDDKKYDATPHKLEEARRQGQASRSVDMVGGVALVSGLSTLFAMRAGLLDGCLSLVRWGALHARVGENIEGELSNLATAALPVAWRLALVALAVCGSAILVGLMQSGGLVSAAAISPKPDNLNPLTGVKRIFSMSHVWDVGKILAKATLLIIVGGTFINARMAEMASLPRMEEGVTGDWLADAAISLIWRLVAVILSIAVFDFAWQQFQFRKNLKMTRQELVEDMRMQEGDPYIKARRRQLQRQMSKRASVQAVKEARVVVTNPTHYAVALAYGDGAEEVPRVLVKGEGHRAQMIKTLALEAKVRVVESPPLARALYSSVDEGHQIPPHLYFATAQVLVMVAELEKRARGTPR